MHAEFVNALRELLDLDPLYVDAEGAVPACEHVEKGELRRFYRVYEE